MPAAFTPPLLLQVCTKLQKGGPNNATYVAGYTILDREHVVSIGIVPTNDQLTGMKFLQSLVKLLCCGSEGCSKLVCAFAVEVDGRRLFMDQTVQTTSLVQTWRFPSKDGNAMTVAWQRYDSTRGAPSVNFTASVPLPPEVWLCCHMSDTWRSN